MYSTYNIQYSSMSQLQCSMVPTESQAAGSGLIPVPVLALGSFVVIVSCPCVALVVQRSAPFEVFSSTPYLHCSPTPHMPPRYHTVLSPSSLVPDLEPELLNI